MAPGYRFLDPDIDKHLPVFPSYWSLEDVSDLFGPNNLTNVGPATFAAGQNNDAVFFTQGDYLNITDGAQVGLEPAGASFSISSWVNIAAFGGDAFHTIVAKSRAAGNNASYQLMVNTANSAINFGISVDGFGITLEIETVNTITLGIWNHVLCIFVPSTSLAVYLNGVKENVTVAVPAAVFNSTADFRIGNRDSGGGAARMVGAVDEVGFINADIGDAGAAAFWNAGVGRFPQAPVSKSVSVFDMRERKFNNSISRFDILRNAILSKSVSRFDARETTPSKSVSRFDFLTQSVSRSISRMDIRQTTESISLSRFGIRGKNESKSISKSNSFIQDGWDLVARNIVTGVFTKLGFISRGTTTLNGIALVDATYDIEARPSGNYWSDCQSAFFLRVEISGGEIVGTTPPAVRNLRDEPLTNFGRDILWTYQNDLGTVVPVDFGLWFSPTSPVDVSGAPDATLVAREAGNTHLFRRVQVAAEFVAVAARDASENKGPISELFLTFPAGTIEAPERQWAVKGN